MTNAKIDANWSPPEHRCDAVADTPTPSTRSPSTPGGPPRIRHRVKGPLGKADVYVDDFILLAQGGKRRQRRLRRVLFHCIDMVFRPPDGQDDKWKKDPISVKKLLKGDGALETVKVILGWLVDTVAGTIELPPNRIERLNEILSAFPRSRRTCPKKDLHKLVGELRSMILALPGGIGCLSWLQETLKTANSRVYLNQNFHDAIEDFKWLANDISSRPTRLAEVVPEAPTLIGTVDASGVGMGGVWLPDGDALYEAALDPTSLAPARDYRRGEDVATAMSARDARLRRSALTGDADTQQLADDTTPSGGPRLADRANRGLKGEMTELRDVGRVLDSDGCHEFMRSINSDGCGSSADDRCQVAGEATAMSARDARLRRGALAGNDDTQHPADLVTSWDAPRLAHRATRGPPEATTVLPDDRREPDSDVCHDNRREPDSDGCHDFRRSLDNRGSSVDDDDRGLVAAALADQRPILWRHPFPDDIVASLVSDSNPTGIINNSELELAGIIATNDIAARESDVHERTTATGTDNIPALSWSSKGAVSAKGPAAYLLRQQAMHQRIFHYQSRGFYIPGEANGMADDCSRLWHLSDDELVSYFNTKYPQPKPWRLCHLNAGTASALFSALRCRRLPLPEILAAADREPSSSADGLLSPSRPVEGQWHVQASPWAHGLRKRLFDSLGKRRHSWASTTRGMTQPPMATSMSRVGQKFLSQKGVYAIDVGVDRWGHPKMSTR